MQRTCEICNNFQPENLRLSAYLQDLETDGKIITTRVKRCENVGWFHVAENGD